MFEITDDSQPTDAEQPDPRTWWIRLYDRLMDWLWFGLLTRDLRPYRSPAQIERWGKP